MKRGIVTPSPHQNTTAPASVIAVARSNIARRLFSRSAIPAMTTQANVAGTRPVYSLSTANAMTDRQMHIQPRHSSGRAGAAQQNTPGQGQDDAESRREEARPHVVNRADLIAPTLEGRAYADQNKNQ